MDYQPHSLVDNEHLTSAQPRSCYPAFAASAWLRRFRSFSDHSLRKIGSLGEGRSRMAWSWMDTPSAFDGGPIVTVFECRFVCMQFWSSLEAPSRLEFKIIRSGSMPRRFMSTVASPQLRAGIDRLPVSFKMSPNQQTSPRSSSTIRTI